MSHPEGRPTRYVLAALGVVAFLGISIDWWALRSTQDYQRATSDEIKTLFERNQQIRGEQKSLAAAIYRSAALDTQARLELTQIDDAVNAARSKLKVLAYLAGLNNAQTAQVAGVIAHAKSTVSPDDVGSLRGTLEELQSTLEEHKNDAAMTRAEMATLADRNRAALQEVSRLAQNPSVPETATYNAIIGPNGSNQLMDSVKTTIRFFIGQPHINAGVPFPKWTVSPAILSVPNTAPLTVTMKCIPCSKNSLQERIITYSSENGASSEATFEILPTRRLARQEDGMSQIVFDVASNGIEYDHLVMDVYVSPVQEASNPAAQVLSPSQGTPAPSINRSGVGGAPYGEPPGSRRADIVFQFFRDPDKLRVRIQPILPELVTLFGDKYLEKGELRNFETGPLSEKDIQDDANAAYVSLTSLIGPRNEAFQKLLSGHPSSSPEIPLSMDFEPEERNAILREFFKVGADFYSKLFTDASAEADLRRLMASFAEFTAHHDRLRVQVLTSNITIPWQLLCPPSDSVESKNFWGFSYELTIVPFRTDGGTPRPILEYSAPDSTVFAGYNDEEFSNHYIIEKGKEESDIVGKTLQHKVDFYDTRDAFLKALDDKRDSVQLIFAYTHATSGTMDFTPGDGGTLYHQDPDGPRLLFSEKKYARPRDIYSLKIFHKSEADHGGFFSAQPFVFLNACETTTLGFNPAGTKDTTGTTAGFPETLLRLGARGVVGTESRVWAPFAFYFGDELLHKILLGAEIPRALLDVRLMYDHDHNNPLGLLYSYYGNPDVQMKVLNSQAKEGNK